MRKIFVAFVFTLLGVSTAWTHGILRDAGTLTRGKVPNERLNCGSSVTCQGFIETSTPGVAISNLQTAFSTNSIHAGNTNYMTVLGSTQVKTGAIIISSITIGSAGKIVAIGAGAFPGGWASGPTLQISYADRQWQIYPTSEGSRRKLYFADATGGTAGIQFDTPGNIFLGGGLSGTSDGPTSRLDILGGSITVRGSGSGLIVGETRLVVETAAAGNNVGIGTADPSSQLDIANGSITIRGTNSGLTVRGGSITIDGTFISTTGFVVGGATITTLSSCDTIDTLANGTLICGTDDSGGAGGGNNQAINTSTGLLITPAFGTVGGAVFLATSPFVPIPGKVFNTNVGTFNVVSIQGYTIVPSTALDANVTMRIAQSTASGFGFGSFSYVSSSASVISSSDSTNSEGGWRFGVEYSTAFKMLPRMSYSLHVTSVPSGGAPPAENFGINVKGWWSP